MITAERTPRHGKITTLTSEGPSGYETQASNDRVQCYRNNILIAQYNTVMDSVWGRTKWGQWSSYLLKNNSWYFCSWQKRAQLRAKEWVCCELWLIVPSGVLCTLWCQVRMEGTSRHPHTWAHDRCPVTFQLVHHLMIVPLISQHMLEQWVKKNIHSAHCPR